MEAKEKYLQTNAPNPLSDSYLQNRFDLPKLHPIVSVEEENSDICDILDDVGEWDFDAL